VAACSLLSARSIYLMVNGWSGGLLLYFQDDVDYFVDVLVSCMT
jgi:hypothetical protein